MGYKSYSKHFKKKNNNMIETASIDQKEEAIQVTVDDKVVANLELEPIENNVELNEADVLDVDVEQTVEGFVDGCARLNVRKRPDKDSEILCVIKKNDKVLVNLSASTTEEFYRICTTNGVVGYCMKKFIKC